MGYASIAHQAGPSDGQWGGWQAVGFQGLEASVAPHRRLCAPRQSLSLAGGPVHPDGPSASWGALCTPTVPQPLCWTSPFFPLSTAAVSRCNYSLTFLPTVIPKPVSSYFPKAPLKSTFSTFQIGRDREKMHVFLPRLRLNCCFCRHRSWTPGPLRPQDFRGADWGQGEVPRGEGPDSTAPASLGIRGRGQESRSK